MYFSLSLERLSSLPNTIETETHTEPNKAKVHHTPCIYLYLLLKQEANKFPIHLKGGLKAALLYRATMTLTVFGMSALL
uniref:Uncharacterized protein n=1 Tax=Seriola dumerili TaxID=41447 RepID=A0A3B4UDE8_SERDU